MLEYIIRTKAFRRGDPFVAKCVLEDGSDAIGIADGTIINATLRTDNSAVVAHLNIEVHDQTKEKGAFTASVDDTSSFPVGTNVYLTVIFVSGNEITASAILSIPVIS